MLRPIRRLTLAYLLVFAAALAPATASAQLHLSIFHPLSTNSNPDAHANLALSIFQSRIGELHGIGVHPLVSEVGGSLSGVQVTGAYLLVRGPLSGILLTGGIANVRGEAHALQLAGIGNFGDGGVSGLQVAGVINSDRGPVKGVQIAGLLNMNGAETGGLQLSSVANISEGPMHGIQAALGVNLAQEEIQGMQFGLANLAGAIDGTQLGFYNIASKASGIQLGAINYAGTNEGIPIGMINLSPNSGRLEVVAFGSTLSAANVGVRTTVNRFQSTLSAGGPDLEGDVETAAFLTWAYGYRLPLGSRCGVSADFGWSHIMPEKSDDPLENDRLHFALSFRVLPEIRLSDNVALFAGPGVTTIFDRYSTSAGSKTEVLGTAGLAVRP
jgi:hypothetical protein